MVRLTGLQIMTIIEIDKLVNELKIVNEDINRPYPPMAEKEQIKHLAYFSPLPEKQTKLIEQIENWTRTLSESITTDVH